MSKNVYDLLVERGYIEQCTNEKELRELFEKEKVTFYIGFDATADSLTAGHFMTLMVMMHLQKAGHRPIALLGGGTTMIGDPSGRSDARNMMTLEKVRYNAECFRKQFEKFLDFSNGEVILENNADWLLDLNYVEFVRDIGRHFKVKEMLAAECYKQRMNSESGLTFFEFNYMLMQSYDFLKLNQKYGCRLQLGGNDQWSNIIGGIHLCKYKENKDVYGLTLKLLTKADGTKMGKSQSGAIWLDENKTTPYEFYQYFRNTDDIKVIEYLKLLTFIEMSEIEELAKLEDAEINKAKERLAFEITKLVHGEEKAKEAMEASRAIFSGKRTDNITNILVDKFDGEKLLIDLLVESKLVPSKSEARRNITQGGISVEDDKITDIEYKVNSSVVEKGLLIKKGKKLFVMIKFA